MTKIVFKAGLIGMLLWLAIVGAVVVGWVRNIIHIVAHISEPLTALEVFRMVGVVVAPLGVILGWVA